MSAPAGTGKTTLAEMVSRAFPSSVVQSISCTTRPPRPGEKDGVDYYFLSKLEFEEKILAGDFLEHAEVFGHYYGTLKRHVEEITSSGKHLLLVIDTQGAIQLQEKILATYVFIAPPSLVELERRLKMRQTDSDEVIRRRLDWAEREIQHADRYDYFIVNEHLHVAFEVLKSIVIAEEHKNQRRN